MRSGLVVVAMAVVSDGGGERDEMAVVVDREREVRSGSGGGAVAVAVVSDGGGERDEIQVDQVWSGGGGRSREREMRTGGEMSGWWW